MKQPIKRELAIAHMNTYDAATLGVSALRQIEVLLPLLRDEKTNRSALVEVLAGIIDLHLDSLVHMSERAAEHLPSAGIEE